VNKDRADSVLDVSSKWNYCNSGVTLWLDNHECEEMRSFDLKDFGPRHNLEVRCSLVLVSVETEGVWFSAIEREGSFWFRLLQLGRDLVARQPRV
jgi:hypothetical protein